MKILYALGARLALGLSEQNNNQMRSQEKLSAERMHRPSLVLALARLVAALVLISTDPMRKRDQQGK